MHIAVNVPAEVHYRARGFLALETASARFTMTAIAVLILGFGYFATLSIRALAHAGPAGSIASALVASRAAAPAASTAAAVGPREEAAGGEPAGEEPTPAAPEPTPFPAPPPGLRVTRMVAPRLGVNHGIERVGVVSNQMQTPVDGVNAVGWYAEYGTPGYTSNAVFSAHETWNRSHGPFYSLHLARPGDTISLTLSDGATARYEVLSNRRYDADSIPMGELIWPSDLAPDEQRATFITCGGRFQPTNGGLGEYLDRDVVIARRV